MNKFKFGDRVIDKHLSLGECVVINCSEHFVYIMNENGGYNTIANPEHLELIKHPDTRRLDWLADLNTKTGQVLLPKECVELNLHDMRAAIDMAMQLEKSEQQHGQQQETP